MKVDRSDKTAIAISASKSIGWLLAPWEQAKGRQKPARDSDTEAAQAPEPLPSDSRRHGD